MHATRATNRLVLPYMAYARQDKRFKPGEPVSSRVVARALSQGVSEVITVNIHEKDVLKSFRVPARNLSLADDIGAYIRTLGLDNPLILAPDEGAMGFAEQVASAGGWEYDHLEKTRLSGVEVKMAPRQLSARSRSVVIVDDIISTGGTIATAAGMLYQQGAQRCLCSLRPWCLHRGCICPPDGNRYTGCGLQRHHRTELQHGYRLLTRSHGHSGNSDPEFMTDPVFPDRVTAMTSVLDASFFFGEFPAEGRSCYCPGRCGRTEGYPGKRQF